MKFEKWMILSLVITGGRVKSELEKLLFEAKSEQEKTIIKILLENFDNLPEMKLGDISNMCGCSKTSVRRVFLKLEYDGFLDYQLHMKMEQEKERKAKEEKETIGKDDKIMEFANFIIDANCVYIYGSGPSNLSAQYLFRMLTELGYIAIWVDDQELLYSLTNKNIIVISNTGRSEKLIKVASSVINERGCKLGTITCIESKLDTLSSVNLHTKTLDLKYVDRGDQIDLLCMINKLLKAVKISDLSYAS